MKDFIQKSIIDYMNEFDEFIKDKSNFAIENEGFVRTITVIDARRFLIRVFTEIKAEYKQNDQTN